MTTTSRMVADRVAISQTVVSAIEVHGAEIAPKLEAILFPEGAPKELSVAGLLDALRAALERQVAKMVTADKTHASELADDDGYRVKREEKLADARAYLISLRTNLTTNYGPKVAEAYGLGDAMPDDAAGVINLGGKVESLLRNRPLVEPAKRKSLAVDPIAAANDVKAATEDLATALVDVEREKREAQLTLGAKNDAMSEWSVRYQGIADATAALLYLAGRQDLATHVKPTARRRAGLPEPEDTTSPDPTTTPAPTPT